MLTYLELDQDLNPTCLIRFILILPVFRRISVVEKPTAVMMAETVEVTIMKKPARLQLLPHPATHTVMLDTPTWHQSEIESDSP